MLYIIFVCQHNTTVNFNSAVQLNSTMGAARGRCQQFIHLMVDAYSCTRRLASLGTASATSIYTTPCPRSRSIDGYTNYFSSTSVPSLSATSTLNWSLHEWASPPHIPTVLAHIIKNMCYTFKKNLIRIRLMYNS